jgi:hypothetical protein
MHFIRVCALECREEETVLGLRGASVEVEVAFEGDVVAILLGVHDRSLATRQTERARQRMTDPSRRGTSLTCLM